MKCRYSILVIIAALIGITGCIRKSDSSEESIHKEEENIIEPGIIISGEVPKNPSTLNTYSLDYYKADEDSAVSALMSHEPDQRLEWAMGPQYIYQNLEYLQFFNEVVQGGLQYTKYKDDSDINTQVMVENLKRMITPREFVSNMSESDKAYLNPFDYEKEYASLSKTEVQETLKQIWKRLDLPAVEMRACYARDQKILNENLKAYNDHQEKPDEYTFKADDEDYLLIYRQTIEGIPVIDQFWYKEVSGTNTVTEFEVIYSPANGLTALRISNLYEIKDKITAVEIKSPQKAIEKYQEEYRKSLHLNNEELICIELNYIVVSNKKELIARPAWIITTKTISQDNTATEYEITAMDAETLEIMKSDKMG